MNRTFILNGGAGRVVAAIPALEKFHRLNPDNDFKVFVYGWESLYWSHPILQSRTFSIAQKGIFENFIRNSDLLVPEPYDRRSYYTQQKSMMEVFDEEINVTDDHSDLRAPSLFLQKQEISSAKFIIDQKKKEQNKDKVIVIQPYGSGIKMINERPYDTTIRSLDVDDYLRIVKDLSKDYLVIYFGDKDFVHPGDDVSWKPCNDLNADLRFWMACINYCDYFLGVDSLGQHIARAFNKPGTVIMGSTIEKNVSYLGHFRFYRNGLIPTYNPIRVGAVDCEFADRLNDNLMDFTEEQLKTLCNNVRNHLSGKSQLKWQW